MPGRKIPRYLGLHRQAGIALYRALLSQCRTVPLPESSQSTLQNIVRNRFWHNRNERSPRRIKTHFRAGFAALDLLDASAAGEQNSTARVVDYLSRIPDNVRHNPNKQNYREFAKPVRGEEARETPPDQQFLNVFPRREAEIQENARNPDGVRREIYIVNAQKFPFVRFKKPQPKNLSRVLRQKAQTDFRLIGRSQWLEGYWVPLAEYEDAWEGMVRKQLLAQGRAGKGYPKQTLGELEDDIAHQASYTGTFKPIAQQCLQDWIELRTTARALMGRMQNIVDAERKMATEERQRVEKRKDMEKEACEGESETSAFD